MNSRKFGYFWPSPLSKIPYAIVSKLCMTSFYGWSHTEMMKEAELPFALNLIEMLPHQSCIVLFLQSDPRIQPNPWGGGHSWKCFSNRFCFWRNRRIGIPRERQSGTDQVWINFSFIIPRESEWLKGPGSHCWDPKDGTIIYRNIVLKDITMHWYCCMLL